MPRRPDGTTPRDEYLRVRTTAQGREQAERQAARNNETLSKYIRRLIKEDGERGG